MKNITSFIITSGLMSLSTVASAQDVENKPWSQADAFYGEEVMAKSREKVQAANGAHPFSMIMGDRLEVQFGGSEETFLWDAQGWYGGDVNKLWIKTEGEYVFEESEIEEAEVQALWSRAISPFWDVQAGVRYDLEPKGRTHAVLGVQGLAPYWFEIDAAAFLTNKGDLIARIEAEYDLHLTQRLIVQPRAELELAAQDIPEVEIGSGLTHMDAGVRLRYDIKREFAPYIGAEWQGSFGDTKDLLKANGDSANRAVILIGLRTWY